MCVAEVFNIDAMNQIGHLTKGDTVEFNLNQVEQDFKVSEDDTERKELLLSVMQEWTRRYNDGSLTFIDAVKYQNVAELMVSELESK